MAVQPVTVVPAEDRVKIITWTGLANGDTGQPVRVGSFKTLTVQRTAGAGTIALEGSNDGTLYGAIGAGVAPDGTVKTIPEGPLFIRPSATVSGGNTIVVIASNPQV